MPRHPHQPTIQTRGEVAALVSFGVPTNEVAKYIGVDPKTLRKHYREELDKSMLTANARVGRFLYQAASGQAMKDGASYSDCIRAAMFWAKTRMQWRETNNLDHTSSDGSVAALTVEWKMPELPPGELPPGEDDRGS